VLKAAIESLQPGDDLLIHGGTYTVSTRVSIDVVGTENVTTRIRAADGEAVRIEQTNPNQNGIEIARAAWLTIRGIEFVGGDLGIRVAQVDHLYFVANEVHDTANTAIAANSTDTSYLYFVDNHIHHTSLYGEGFYLGANYQKYITHHTYVVGNHVHDTATGPGGKQGDGVEIKNGSYACVIADNLIERTNYPGILVYGTGGRPERNLIERNIVVDSREGGIQAAADAIVRNNLVIGADDACIVSQSHQGASPANLDILHNTLVNDGICLRVSGWSGSGLVVANNAFYSASGTPTAGSFGPAAVSTNLTLAGLSSFTSITLDGSLRDATPAPGSILIDAGDPLYAVVDDLEGRTRDGSPDVGASERP